MRLRTFLLTAAAAACALMIVECSRAQPSVAPAADMVLDGQALLLPATAQYGRAINGVSYQDNPIVSFGGYQYATWYHYTNPTTERIFVGRRNLETNTWESFDLGKELSNGDEPVWDAHNVISMGISGDGRIHLSYDMHVNDLRYQESNVGVATNPASTPWNASIFTAERNKLNPAHATQGSVTYPRFAAGPAGEMVMTFRRYSSGNGDVVISRYDSETHNWSAPQDFINRPGTYTDYFGTSTNRNAYLNGIDFGPSGTLHTTWVWREATPSGRVNRDFNYAYSEDGGITWKNNDGMAIGWAGNPMTTNSPGVRIEELDRKEMLFNQQAQTVDNDNRVHALMYHRRDEPGFEWTTSDGMDIFKADAAYYHYIRDPSSGDWTRRRLPVDRPVGSRPEIAYDSEGNVYAAFVSPGPSDPVAQHSSGRLVIAGASKATNYSDWSILSVDERSFIGEPMIDRPRLRDNGILSVFVQENSPVATNTGSPLHLLEFTARPANLSSHLRAHYPFEGNAQDAATADGMQNLGLHGNANTSGGKLVLNSSLDYATATTNLAANRNAVTVTTWFTPTQSLTGAPSEDYTIFQMPIAGGAPSQSAVGLDISDGKLQVGGRSQTSESFQGVVQSGILQQGKTYFAAAVIDYEWKRVTSYLYDQESGVWTTATATANFTARTTVGEQGISIGRRADGLRSFLGTIDDVRIYDVALSQEAVQSLVIIGMPGDFDSDGDVDGRDFLVWQRGESPSPHSAEDLAAWSAHYGAGGSAELGSVQVPEPHTLAIVTCALVMTTLREWLP